MNLTTVTDTYMELAMPINDETALPAAEALLASPWEDMINEFVVIDLCKINEANERADIQWTSILYKKWKCINYGIAHLPVLIICIHIRIFCQDVFSNPERRTTRMHVLWGMRRQEAAGARVSHPRYHNRYQVHIPVKNCNDPLFCPIRSINSTNTLLASRWNLFGSIDVICKASVH